MFERYNEPARRAIFFARWWAINRPAKAIETKDLILGAVHDTAASDSPYFFLGSQREAMVALLAAEMNPVLDPGPARIPLSVDSRRAHAFAAMEAELDGRASIDPFHLYRGVLRTGDETAQALIARGHTLETLREASRIALPKLLDQHGKIPWRWRLTPKVRAIIDWGIIAFCTLCFAAMVLYLRSQN